MSVPCKLCGKRRARRHCPGIEGDICPQCCGAERENTIHCPSTCEHLREARLHEAAAPITEAELAQMKAENPVSPRELAEQKQEEEFLSGGKTSASKEPGRNP